MNPFDDTFFPLLLRLAVGWWRGEFAPPLPRDGGAWQLWCWHAVPVALYQRQNPQTQQPFKGASILGRQGLVEAIRGNGVYGGRAHGLAGEQQKAVPFVCDTRFSTSPI